MEKLSVIIITNNEAHTIMTCLESVRFANEIIVIDSGSTDETVALCQQFGARVQVTDWPGYGIQKNRALALASGDWILSLDADERVSVELAEEIQTLLREQMASATQYAIPFQSFFLGHRIRFGDWRNEKHIRLFKKNYHQFDNAGLHENLIGRGQLGSLHNLILHEPYRDWQELQDKVIRYGEIGATLRKKRGKKGGLLAASVHAWWAFLRSYLFRVGCLDGRPGLWLAVSIAQYTFLRYR